jgi:hypothetical protein
MYSLHELLALMRPLSGQVFQSLMVSSKWMPGSEHSHAASAILRNRSPVASRAQVEPLVGGHGPHEGVRHPDGVVGVLKLDGIQIAAAHVHVEAGVVQRADLALLAGLALDEVHDIGMIHVEDDDLRRRAGGAAGADGSRRGIGAAHETHRAGGGPARGREFRGGPEMGEVHTRPGAAVEEQRLVPVPVQDGFEAVLGGKNEARRDLLGRVRAHVEPDRAVETERLVQQ